MLAAVEDDPQVELVPMLAGEELFQIPLSLLDTPPVRQFPPLGEPVNVGVHRERRFAKGLRHHDTRGLVPHPRQRFEFLKRPRHLAAMSLKQQF
jgi:hypothetical protein